jgi:hypothetical protein
MISGQQRRHGLVCTSVAVIQSFNNKTDPSELNRLDTGHAPTPPPLPSPVPDEALEDPAAAGSTVVNRIPTTGERVLVDAVNDDEGVGDTGDENMPLVFVDDDPGSETDIELDPDRLVSAELTAADLLEGEFQQEELHRGACFNFIGIFSTHDL